MPHISGRKLKSKTLKKLNDKFLSTFENAHRQHGFNKVFRELFTYTEKIMLAKRLAIIFLLSKQIPQHRIVKALKVSPSTVAKMSLKLELEKYNSILKIFDQKKSGLVDFIEYLLSGGGLMPPIAGRGRWKKLFQNQ